MHGIDLDWEVGSGKGMATRSQKVVVLVVVVRVVLVVRVLVVLVCFRSGLSRSLSPPSRS